MFLYCGNNPVRFSDDKGTFWDLALDIVFTIASAIEVVKNPTSGKAWAALGADLICMAIPGVTGGGLAVRAVSKVDDVIDAGRAATSASSKMKRVAEAGKAGELASGITKNTTRIYDNLVSGAKYRIPDGLTSTTLIEVKNYSGTLSYTAQLRDFVAYSQAHGLKMQLYTNANLSKPLQKLVDDNVIEHLPILF